MKEDLIKTYRDRIDRIGLIRNKLEYIELACFTAIDDIDRVDMNENGSQKALNKIIGSDRSMMDLLTIGYTFS